MNLFLENGHLSEQGLKALVNETLDEMQRLEAAEHLSFCDECLLKYTELLTEDVCMEPEQDLVLPVARQVRQNFWKENWIRGATAAAAVVLTFALWAGGAFSGIEPSAPKLPKEDNEKSSFHMKEALRDFSDRLTEMANYLTEGIDSVVKR